MSYGMWVTNSDSGPNIILLLLAIIIPIIGVALLLPASVTSHVTTVHYAAGVASNWASVRRRPLGMEEGAMMTMNRVFCDATE